jgi:hypothetical protein
MTQMSYDKTVEEFLIQIRASNKQGLYLVSLLTALTMPSICGSLSSADGTDSAVNYVNWYDTYMFPHYANFFSGAACYKFRCSMLHQGSTQTRPELFSRVFFTEPTENQPITMHLNKFGDALNIDVKFFCEDMCKAVEKWLVQTTNDANYAKHKHQLITRHPNGLSPYVQGIPVIS